MVGVKRAQKMSFKVVVAMAAFFNLGVFAHAAEMKKISLGYSTVGPAGTGLWMAKEIGAFEKYGVDADRVVFVYLRISSSNVIDIVNVLFQKRICTCACDAN